ncbi:MAG: DinB family protein [Pirellulales bacterium]
MNTKDSLKMAGDMSLFVLKKFIADVSDEELLNRPAPGCNHLAWQLGHVISSEVYLLNSIAPGAKIDFPPGFVENHAKGNKASDDPAQFLKRDEYVALFDQVRAATYEALDAMPDSKLDEPGPEAFRSVFPTVGHVAMLVMTHPLMHSGQFAVSRRNLGKPIVI